MKRTKNVNELIIGKRNKITGKKVFKQLSAKGQLTVPIDVRRKVGWYGGGTVKIEVLDDGSLLIKAEKPVCSICTVNKATVVHKGVHFCKSCVKTLKEVSDGNQIALD